MVEIVRTIPIPKHLHVFAKYEEDETGEFYYSECDLIGIDKHGLSYFLEIDEECLFAPDDVSNFIKFIIIRERNTCWMNETEFNIYKGKINEAD